MEWLLMALLPAFVLLAILIKPLYDKWYDSGIIAFKGVYDPRLDAYLRRFEDEAKIRANLEQYAARGYAVRHLDKPGNWEKDLQSFKEKVLRVLSQAVFVAYVILMVFLIWRGVSYGWFVSGLRDGAKFLAPFSLVAALYWRHRRSSCDGSLQGYLNGYMDALEHMALKDSAHTGYDSKGEQERNRNEA
jgi:hypothetical protein